MTLNRHMLSDNLKKELRRLARYFMIGVTGSGFGIFISWNLHENLNLSEPISVGISVAILYILYFFMVRTFVFKSHNKLLKQALRYLIVSFVMRTLEYSVFLLLFYTTEIYYLMSYTASIALIFIVKYFVHKHIVFKAD